MKTKELFDFPTKRRKVGVVLNKNRTLLKRLRQESKVNELADSSFMWLRNNGFDFNYHTHIESLPNGKLAVMCYEVGYVLEVDGVRLLPPASAALLA
jgi:hypothetical protein